MFCNIIVLHFTALLPPISVHSGPHTKFDTDAADIGTRTVNRSNYIGILGVGGGWTQTTVASPRARGIFEVGGGGTHAMVSSPRFFWFVMSVGTRTSRGSYVFLRLRARSMVSSSRFFSWGSSMLLRPSARSIVLSVVVAASFPAIVEM